jgi:hypothetical protein
MLIIAPVQQSLKSGTKSNISDKKDISEKNTISVTKQNGISDISFLCHPDNRLAPSLSFIVI